MAWEWANLTIALAGLLTGVAGAYFGYLAVRERLRRPARRRPGPPVPSDPGGPYDAFVSYGRDDAVPAEALAARLAEHGLRVFLARRTEPGLIPCLEAERALLGSANGVLLYSRSTMDDPDPGLRDEYAALLGRVHSGGRRFVPALLDDVAHEELPPFARIRGAVDLRRPGTPHHDRQIDALVRALRSPQPDPSG